MKKTWHDELIELGYNYRKIKRNNIVIHHYRNPKRMKDVKDRKVPRQVYKF